MVNHHKRKVTKGTAVIEGRPISRDDCERMKSFREKKIASLDKQIERLQKKRAQQVVALQTEIDTIAAIDAGGNFSE